MLGRADNLWRSMAGFMLCAMACCRISKCVLPARRNCQTASSKLGRRYAAESTSEAAAAALGKRGEGVGPPCSEGLGMTNRARVIGIHPVAADEPVHLVELEVEGNAADFDFGEITQEAPGQPRNNGQAVYGEREVGENRFAFFFHYLDTAKPLLSPVGPLPLPPESPVPVRLQGVEYEQP